ncbi:MAG TPA: hypothetical protein VE715_07265, partial [Blastocatellia bacterium]|nr:hypothetical protein [Blastocatellia bacterium]
RRPQGSGTSRRADLVFKLRRNEGVGLRIADCGFMSQFNRGLEIKIESFINPQSAIRNPQSAIPR